MSALDVAADLTTTTPAYREQSEPAQAPPARAFYGGVVGPGPRPAIERRERRAMVEELMISGFSFAVIVKQVQARFLIQPKAIRVDMGRIERRWLREDAKGLALQRDRAVRRLRRLAGKAEAAGDYGASVRAEDVAAKIGGVVAAPAPQVTFNQLNVGMSAIASLVAQVAQCAQQALPGPDSGDELEQDEELVKPAEVLAPSSDHLQ